MSDKFVNVKINVNGKVHNVRIQEGIGFDNDNNNWHGGRDSAWHVKNGSLFAWEEQKETHKGDDGYIWTYGNNIFTPKKTNEIKMTEAEFALLRNVADNVNESGDVLTLSRADIEKAQDLFSQGKFTADVTKNLPAGYHGSKDIQDMKDGECLLARINNYDKNQDALTTAKGKEYTYDIASLTFYNEVQEDKYLEIYAKKSSDGCVKRTYQGEGDGGAEWTLYTYKDKDGNLITESPDYNSAMAEYGYETNAKGTKLMRFEGTDAQGKHVITEFAGYVDVPLDDWSRINLGVRGSYEQIKTSKTSDGKEFIELYDKDDNDYFTLKNILIKYKDGNKDIVELKDEKGQPSKKTVDYTENGKTIHEDYDKDNKLVEKIVKYKKGNADITEVYNSKKTLVQREILPDGDWTKAVTEYYENGKFVKKEKSGQSERYIKGDTVFVNNNAVTRCADFNVQEQTNKELSEKAKEYKDAYKKQNSVQIARAIKEQIEGPSKNEKTIAMVKAIPTNQFVEVLKQYKDVDSWMWFDKASLFTDLMDEWFMDDKELVDIAKQAFASYMQCKKPDKVTEQDVNMAKFVQAGPGNDIKGYMLKIEEYVTK